LGRKVTIHQSGKARKVPLIEAMLLKAAEEALHGELKATVSLLNRLMTTQSEEPITSELSPDETEVMKAYAERLLNQAREDREKLR
jgi:hypothetical protein